MTQPSPLENLSIASPCSADWADMTGSDQVRHCAQCDMNVYNLTAMNRSEAESLVQTHEGRLCVRFFQRADGTILTKDCPVGLSRRYTRQVQIRKAGVAAACLIIALSGIARAQSVPSGTLLTGSMVPPPAKNHVSQPTPQEVKGNVAEPRPVQPIMGSVPVNPPPKMGEMVLPEKHKHHPKAPKAPKTKPSHPNPPKEFLMGKVVQPTQTNPNKP